MIMYQLFRVGERERVVDIINQVAGEGKLYRYCGLGKYIVKKK